MSLIDELDSYIAKEYGITLKEYRYINVGDKVFYIEGHKGIKILSENEVSFALKNKILCVFGEKLYVKYYDETTAIIFGTIKKIEVV